MSLLVDRAIPAGWNRSPLGILTPPPNRREYDLPVAVDLFAGAGGFSCGFHRAGFHVAAASEMWVDAAMTYLCNLARPGVQVHFDTPQRVRQFSQAAAKQLGVLVDEHGYVTGPDPKRKGPHLTAEGMRIGAAGTGWIAGQPRSQPGCEHFFVYDIRNLTGQIILDALGLEVGEVAVVMGGPPCQGYSAAGKRNVMDPRNSLVFEFMRLVCEIKPRTFVMENVTGLRSMVTPEGIPVLDAIALACDDGGYGEYDAIRRALSGREKAQAVVRGANATGDGKKAPRQPGRKAAKQKRAPAPEGALW